MSSGDSETQIRLLESLLALGLKEQAYSLIEKCNVNQIKQDPKLLGVYLSLIAEKDLSKAI